MKHPTLQFIDKSLASSGHGGGSSKKGRHGWFRRFGENVVRRRLDAATQSLIREEKYASAVVVSFRISRELEEPLRDLDRLIAELGQFAKDHPELQRVVAGLSRDRRAIQSAISRLGEMEPPSGAAA